MKPGFLKIILLCAFCSLACEGIAQVRIGPMRGLSHSKKKLVEVEVIKEKRPIESVFVSVTQPPVNEARKEMDAVFYVPWNAQTGLYYDDFLSNKNLYNKFITAKDTDLTKVIYPDYRAFYQKLTEKMNAAHSTDDSSWQEKVMHMLAERPDSIYDEDMMSADDTSGAFVISIDSPAASVITISPVIYAINEGTWYYNISALFNRYESWMIVKSKDILDHEQVHFDIFELYARKMRQLLIGTLRKNYADGTTSDLSNDISPSFEVLYQQLNEMQLEFDKETMSLTSSNAPLHSTNNRWRKKLKYQLDQLSEYELAEGHVILR